MGMKLSDKKPEYAVKKGEKTFKYAEDDNGDLRIVEIEGVEESDNNTGNLLERMQHMNSQTCAVCLSAELNKRLFQLMFMQLLDSEQEDWI